MTLGSKIAWDDTVLPFQLDASDMRGRVARLDGVLDGILKQHNYPQPVEALVAEMALLTALNPLRHRPMLIGIMSLYVLRLLNHLMQMDTLHEVFKVPTSTSYRSIGILAVVIILLAIFWPRKEQPALAEAGESTEESPED